MINDGRGGIEDTPGFSDLGLLLDARFVVVTQNYDLAEELLVNLAENVRQYDRELVWAPGVIQARNFGLGPHR